MFAKTGSRVELSHHTILFQVDRRILFVVKLFLTVAFLFVVKLFLTVASSFSFVVFSFPLSSPYIPRCESDADG